MNQRRVTDATLRVRDMLYEGLLAVLPEEIARERANNLSMAALEALCQLADESKPPPFPATDAAARAVPGQDVIAGETMDEHAGRIIT